MKIDREKLKCEGKKYCLKAKELLSTAKTKAMEIWNSGRNGKIALGGAAVLVLVVVSLMFSGGSSSEMTYEDLLNTEFKTAEELAQAVVKFDMHRHWEDFHEPLEATSFRIVDLEHNSTAISFKAVFEPEASEYFIRADRVDGDMPDNISVQINNEMCVKKAAPFPDEKTVKRLNALARKAKETMPELYVFRKMSKAETNRRGFGYPIEYGVSVVTSKNGSLVIDGNFGDGRVDSVIYVGENDRRFFEIGNIGVTSEYIARRKDVFPILATGKTSANWLSGKWAETYATYRRLANATWDDFSTIEELQYKMSCYDSDPTVRKAHFEKPEVRAAIRDAKNLCREIEKVLTNLPKTPRL